MLVIGEGVPNVVVPTIRCEEHLKEFFDAWKDEFRGCHVIVVFDMPEVPVWAKSAGYCFTSYSWKDIDEELGDKSWIIPRRSDCVRSYGYFKAWQNNPLFIVSLDDDVRPVSNGHIQRFYERLFHEDFPDHHFFNTLKPVHSFPRGTYGKTVGCQVVHGGWLGVPDLSGVAQAKGLGLEETGVDSFNEGLVPVGCYFSFCGMNIAWRPEVTPLMYFGLQGKVKKDGVFERLPVDRCGDIWCGYRLTRNNVLVASGEPYVNHERASNVWNNIVKEENAEKMSLQLLANKFDGEFVEYWGKLKEAERLWKELFTLA